VGFREPLGAFLGRAAEFTVLLGECLVSEGSCGYGAAWESMLAARSRTYFWGQGADAAVDYGLGRTDVRGICCFGHGEGLYSGIDGV
jgi:hypothetical protein